MYLSVSVLCITFCVFNSPAVAVQVVETNRAVSGAVHGGPSDINSQSSPTRPGRGAVLHLTHKVRKNSQELI